MKRLLLWTTLTITTFTFLLVVARVVGYAIRSPGNVMIDTSDCQQPCWRKIQPGTTTLAQVRVAAAQYADFKQVRSRFDNEACWETLAEPSWRACVVYLFGARSAQTIQLLHIDPPQGTLTLGDAVALFGEPIAASLCWWNMNLPKMPGYFLRGRVYFDGYIEAWVYDPKQPLKRHYTPEMIVYTFRYHYPDTEPPYRFDTPRWPGFTRAVREDC